MYLIKHAIIIYYRDIYTLKLTVSDNEYVLHNNYSCTSNYYYVIEGICMYVVYCNTNHGQQ